MAIFVPTLAYYKPVCHKILDVYLYQNDFKPHDKNVREHGITYSNGHVFLGFSYCDQYYPVFDLMIGIGFIQENNAIIDNGIALGHDIPRSDTSANYWDWNFKDAEELEYLLNRVKDNVLPLYAKPLWDEPQKLKALFRRITQSEVAKQDAEATNKIKHKAGEAFWAGRYKEVIMLYEKLPIIDFSRLDTKRLMMARKLLAGCSGPAKPDERNCREKKDEKKRRPPAKNDKG